MSKLYYIDIFQADFPFFIADTVFSPAYVSQPHTHNFFEFFLVREGSLKHCVNGQSQILSKGDVFFVLPNDQHWFELPQNESKAVLTNVAFTPNEYDRVLFFLQYKGLESETDLARKIALMPEFFLSITKRFDEIYQLSGNWNFGKLKSLFRLLLDEIMTLYMHMPLRQEEKTPQWLTNACKQMELQSNYSKGINQFFSLTQKTQEHVTRTLKKYQGISPSKFINDIRIIEAARLLRNTNNSINEIITETGFDNPSYFNRLFKSRYGLSPLKYRQLNYSIIN